MSIYDKITIGKYVNKDSLINRLDPRAKIIGVFMLSLSVFFPKDLLAFVVCALFLFVVVLLARLPLKFVIGGLAPTGAQTKLTWRWNPVVMMLIDHGHIYIP